MNILAIDPGTKCGYALLVGTQIISGTWDLRTRRTEGAGMRLMRFRAALNEIVRACDGKMDRIVYEEVHRHLGTDAAHIYGALVGTLMEWCEENGFDKYEGIPVQTIKKHATGRGNAKKNDMESAACKRGWVPCDDNEADALWLLDYARTRRE